MPHLPDNQTINKLNPVVVDMPQVVMRQPSELEINTVAAVPMSKGGSFSVGVIVPVADALTDNKIALSKLMQSKRKHQGIVELPQTWKTAPTFELVSDSSSSAWQPVPPDPRPLLALGTNESGFVYTTPGTFTKTNGYRRSAVYADGFSGSSSAVSSEAYTSIAYDNNASSSSSNNGLVEGIPAMEANAAQDDGVIIDVPGKSGGTPMTEENYLTMPGREIVTSETYLG